MRMKMKMRVGGFSCWILSLVVFFGLIYWASITGVELNPVSLMIVLGSVPFGVFAFLAFIASFASSGKKEKPKENKVSNGVPLFIHKPINPWFLFSMILLLVVAYLVGSRNAVFLGFTSSVALTPIPTQQIVPTSTPIVQKQTKQNTGTNDPDPIVNCSFTYLPDQKMKQSECSKAFECQIGNQWYFYTSHEKCDQDQAAGNKPNIQNNTQSNTNEVTCEVIGYSQLNKVWTYLLTPEECATARREGTRINTTTSVVVTPIPTIDNSAEIRWCMDRAKSTYDSAKTDCSYKARAYGITSSSWYNDCVQTAQNNYVYAQSLCK